MLYFFPFMPFTLSHPAASVPFVRRGLILSALIIGSMAPDFPYFLMLNQDADFGHTLPGLIIFCVPAGFLLLWVYQRVLKLPLLSLLPERHQQRLEPVIGDFRFLPMGRFGLILLSLFIGAFTHILWDSFTHSDGLMVQNIAILNMTLLTLGTYQLSLYKVLQHGSTLIGGGLLLYWYWRWYRTAPVEPLDPLLMISTRKKVVLILGMLSISILMGGLLSFLRYSHLSNFEVLERFIVRAVIAGMSIFLLEMLIYGLYWHWQHKGDVRNAHA
jgi:hypothetical protein